MYFDNDGNISIANKELIQYHKKIKSNLYLPLSEVLYADNPLFIVEENELVEMNYMFKVIPLFYCDKIETDSPNVIILEENKGLIVWDTFINYEGFVNFIAYNEVNDIGLHYDILDFNEKKLLSGTVYETENYTNIKNAEIELSYNDKKYKISSDSYGGFILELEDYTSQEISFTIKYENIIKSL